MLQFMGDNKRLLNLHEHKLSKLGAFKSNTQIFQTNTSSLLKNLETQVGQLALTFQKETRMLSLVTPRKIQKTVWKFS